MYGEPFGDTFVDWLFTNATKTAIATNVITVIREAAINTILISFTADHREIAPIINSMLTFSIYRASPQKFSIWTAGTVRTALNAILATGHTQVMFQINTVSVFVDSNNFAVLDFAGLSFTGPVCHINTATAPGVVSVGVDTGATPLTPA